MQLQRKHEKHGFSIEEVIGCLEKAIPHYEKVNKVISFGLGPRMRKQAVELAGIQPGFKVLDLGCGPGVSSVIIAKKLGRGELFCLDASDRMLKEAKNKLLPYKGVNKKFIKGFFEELPFPNSSFDVVFASYSFRDSLNKLRVLQAIHRVLKENGTVVILDVFKPLNECITPLSSLYIRYLVPAISKFISMNFRDVSPWSLFYATFQEMWNFKTFLKFFTVYFKPEIVKSRLFLFFLVKGVKV